MARATYRPLIPLLACPCSLFFSPTYSTHLVVFSSPLYCHKFISEDPMNIIPFQSEHAIPMKPYKIHLKDARETHDFLWICWRSSNVILNSLVLHGILILSQALNHAASTCTISVHFYMQLYNNVQYTEHLISYFCSQDFLYVIVIYYVVFFLFTLSQEVAPPSPSREPVVLKSNLHKKGKRLRGWHQRYFEIQGTHMYYYKNQTVSNN